MTPASCALPDSPLVRPIARLRPPRFVSLPSFFARASTLCSHARGRASTPIARGSAPLEPRRSRRSWLQTALLGGALWLSFAPNARADANVVVELKRADGSPAEGTVLLSKGELKLRCTTSQGRCEIKNVPGGSYTVEVEQGAQPAGKPKLVMIPPSGEVKLNVAAK